MFYKSDLFPDLTRVVHVAHKQEVLDRIVKCVYTDHDLRASILKRGIFLKSYNSTHGMPAGYEYELDVSADFDALISMFESHGIWTVRGLDFETKMRHMNELEALHDLARSERNRALCANL